MIKLCSAFHNGICYGVKFTDKCSCGGDKTKCDFYESVRIKGAEEKKSTPRGALIGCMFCGGATKVVDSVVDGYVTYQRRKCKSCGKFTYTKMTIEIPKNQEDIKYLLYKNKEIKNIKRN